MKKILKGLAKKKAMIELQLPGINYQGRIAKVGPDYIIFSFRPHHRIVVAIDQIITLNEIR